MSTKESLLVSLPPVLSETVDVEVGLGEVGTVGGSRKVTDRTDGDRVVVGDVDDSLGSIDDGGMSTLGL